MANSQAAVRGKTGEAKRRREVQSDILSRIEHTKQVQPAPKSDYPCWRYAPLCTDLSGPAGPAVRTADVCRILPARAGAAAEARPAGVSRGVREPRAVAAARAYRRVRRPVQRPVRAGADASARRRGGRARRVH